MNGKGDASELDRLLKDERFALDYGAARARVDAAETIAAAMMLKHGHRGFDEALIQLGDEARIDSYSVRQFLAGKNDPDDGADLLSMMGTLARALGKRIVFSLVPHDAPATEHASPADQRASFERIVAAVGKPDWTDAPKIVMAGEALMAWWLPSLDPDHDFSVHVVVSSQIVSCRDYRESRTPHAFTGPDREARAIEWLRSRPGMAEGEKAAAALRTPAECNEWVEKIVNAVGVLTNRRQVVGGHEVGSPRKAGVEWLVNGASVIVSVYPEGVYVFDGNRGASSDGPLDTLEAAIAWATAHVPKQASPEHASPPAAAHSEKVGILDAAPDLSSDESVNALAYAIAAEAGAVVVRVLLSENNERHAVVALDGMGKRGVDISAEDKPDADIYRGIYSRNIGSPVEDKQFPTGRAAAEWLAAQASNTPPSPPAAAPASPSSEQTPASEEGEL